MFVRGLDIGDARIHAVFAREQVAVEQLRLDHAAQLEAAEFATADCDEQRGEARVDLGGAFTHPRHRGQHEERRGVGQHARAGGVDRGAQRTTDDDADPVVAGGDHRRRQRSRLGRGDRSGRGAADPPLELVDLRLLFAQLPQLQLEQFLLRRELCLERGDFGRRCRGHGRGGCRRRRLRHAAPERQHGAEQHALHGDPRSAAHQGWAS